MIGCMDVCDSGEYYLEGQPIHTMSEKELGAVRNKEIGFIFQIPVDRSSVYLLQGHWWVSRHSFLRMNRQELLISAVERMCFPCLQDSMKWEIRS